MPNYNLVCLNGHKQFDVFLKIGERPPCPECGGATETLWTAEGGIRGCISDSIPGGILIRHGLCDLKTKEPIRYYSHTDIKREAEKRGLVNVVEHKPSEGSDKNEKHHTTRWY